MSKFINIVCCEVHDVPADVYIVGLKLFNIATSGLICILKQQTINLRKNKLFASAECAGEKNITSAMFFLYFLDGSSVSPERVSGSLGLPDTMTGAFLFEK
jgi:hypothetical protein